MEIFINECSLTEQYNSQYEFNKAIKSFVKAITYLANVKHEKKIFKSKFFFNYRGIKNTHLQSSLRNNPSINELFFRNIQQINPKSWQEDQKHDENDSYIFDTQEFSGTSVAELTERKNLSSTLKGFLLNFSLSSLFANNKTIEVIKNKNDKFCVDCADSYENVYDWLVDNGYIDPSLTYNHDSELPPMDSQTVLNDTTKFELTTHPKNKGRCVYRRIGTNQLWVVDSSAMHVGEGAHIEVFNENSRNHLGTSPYNEIRIDTTKAKKNRKIDLG